MERTKIINLLKTSTPIDRILVKGWVRTRRDSRGVSFIEINDGSSLKNLQIVVDESIINYEEIKKLSVGSALSVLGHLIASQGKGQQWEVQAETIQIISHSPESYPLQKKRHTDEYLRTIAHLRPRTNKYGAAFRIRSAISFAIHQFFRDRGFTYIHSPILTGSDCEGAGQLFTVTTRPLDPCLDKDKAVDFSEDFFGKEAYLTVSGQLEAEMFALSLGDVYTFGPTFRAENSNTRKHAAEFWMVEPEMAFCDLKGNMELGETLVKTLISFALASCSDDMELFSKWVDTHLLDTLDRIVSSEFIRLPYGEAVDILSRSNKHFDYAVSFGSDLQTEHERFLTEKHFKRPVIVYDYPLTIKPFYMRLNDDKETVAAMDVLVPNIGEIIGGSQREERLDVLESRMDASGLDKADYWWYLDSRRFGSVEHSGFGLGFERLLMLITGISNIRDVIPFPRTPKNIDF
jgi:asparaginyl-tRNA synthetase